MKKKINLNAAALLCTMAMTSLNVYSAAPTDFTELKNAIKEEGSVDIQDLQSSIMFSEVIEIKKEVSISGKKGDNTASFTLDPNIEPPEPPATEYNSPAFTVYDNGDLTLKYLNVTGFGGESAKSVISNSGKLTIGPGVTFQNNKVTATLGGRPYPMRGGIITNSGEMIIETEEDGDVDFEKVTDGGNPNPDIQFSGNGSLDIKGTAGTVTFGNGISYDTGNSSTSSGSTITHSGTNSVILKGQNDKYTGTYTNIAGSLTFDKDGETFFGGKSEFTGGELKWENNKDNAIVSGASLTISGADLTIGDGSNEAKLTASDNVSIEKAKNIDIKQNGELVLSKNTTFDNSTNSTTLQGSGKLTLSDGQTLSLIGQVINDNTEDEEEGNNLHFSSNNSTVNIQNVSNGAKELSVILGSNANNTGLTLNLKAYTSGGDEEDITVDGTDMKTLNFQEGTNTYNGKITISNNGVVTNQSGADTTINDGVSIEGTDASLVNENSATLTIGGTNGLDNSGKVDNKGTLKLTGSLNTNESGGTITNTGSVVVDNGLQNEGNFTSTGSGSFSAQSLINQSGTFDMSESTGEFTVTGSVQNNSGSIIGQSAAFGSYRADTNGGTNLNLTGD